MVSKFSTFSQNLFFCWVRSSCQKKKQHTISHIPITFLRRIFILYMFIYIYIYNHTYIHYIRLKNPKRAWFHKPLHFSSQKDQLMNSPRIAACFKHVAGCMTYTHTHGAQNRFMEFTKPILKDNKPGGPWALLVFGRSSQSETPKLGRQDDGIDG